MGVVKRRVMRGLLDTRCDRRIDMHMYRHPYTDVAAEKTLISTQPML